MDKFELAQTQEERDVIEKNFRQKLTDAGIEDWKIEELLAQANEENEKVFGLANVFPILSEIECGMIETLFEQRKELIFQQQEYYDELISLREKLTDVNNKLAFINQSICSIQGHRLFNELECQTDYDCHKHITGEYNYRICAVCGARVGEKKITKKDVVVKMKKPKKDNKLYISSM